MTSKTRMRRRKTRVSGRMRRMWRLPRLRRKAKVMLRI